MYDYIVVGAGAAGAAAAWRFAQHGAKVLCVDRGSELDRSKYPTTQSNWELLKQTEFSPVASTRGNEADYPVDDSESPIAICNYNAVGGSTILYSGHYPRFLRSDFKLASDEQVGVDWPLEYDELLPYFELNESEMAMSGLPGDPYFPEIEQALPPVPLGKIGERLAEGFNQLSWHWWPSFAAISTRSRGERSHCINLGPCNVGCPQEAKSSVDITYLHKARSYDFQLESNFAVARVLTEDNKAVGVEGYNSEGEIERFLGKNVVLASSAVGTPRILLNSKNDDYPNGLANSSGLVGKNLMIHPLGYVEGVFDEYLETDIGPQGCMLYSLEFYRNEESQHQLGYMMHALRGAGAVEVAKSALSRRKLRFGEDLYNDFSSFYGRQAVIAIICEDLPETKNLVELDPDNCDRFGVPGVKVSYELSDNTKKMMVHGMGRAREVMAAAGAKKSYAHGPVRNTGWHIMGTCKMGSAPNNSVVDAKGKCHDVDGLYVVDSSVFPTSSCVNPANTIQTVALYLADRIHESN
ncbi:GMC family oxidoreductase [Neptuniibacter sp. SY11_33]|uniref:GMC family oxidoreductase n=1 Tax=Neptuniibacter sp. SY11_33 TaxID=3398215 RepID=UPI0039F63F1E